MQRTLAFCVMLPFAGAAFAAPPPAPASAQSVAAAADQQRMAALQARMNDLARQMAALSTKLGDEANATALHYLADSRRGMFGMAVMGTNGGLRVDAVTPGGPAEHAASRPATRSRASMANQWARIVGPAKACSGTRKPGNPSR